MKVHTANYTDTFIAIADDSPATQGEVPPSRGDKRSVANVQYEMISKHPYKYTSDDVLFQVYAEHYDLTKSEFAIAREQFFSKGEPCLRASPLTKRYGWGVHNDKNGKVALVGAETAAYKKFLTDKTLNIVKAMRSKR